MSILFICHSLATTQLFDKIVIHADLSISLCGASLLLHPSIRNYPFHYTCEELAHEGEIGWGEGEDSLTAKYTTLHAWLYVYFCKSIMLNLTGLLQNYCNN